MSNLETPTNPGLGSSLLIDSHAHLDYDYEFSTDELLTGAQNSGVSHIIAIAAEPDSIERVKDLANAHTNLFHTSGVHPHEAKDWTKELAKKVRDFGQLEKCVATGELGLDYYYDHSDSKEQIPCMEEQLEISVDIGKPIVVHTRDAEEDTKSLLTLHAKAWREKYPAEKAPGVIHCFTASQDFAEFALAEGYFISFSGIITFKNAEDLRNVVRITPMDRLLVETDSPYLAPVPYRGKKNQPAYVLKVAEKVAELKELPLSEIAKQTRANTIHLFNLPIQD